MTGNEFRFFLSCDINLPVTFRIERLEGNLPFPNSPNSGLFLFILFKFIYISNFGILNWLNVLFHESNQFVNVHQFWLNVLYYVIGVNDYYIWSTDTNTRHDTDRLMILENKLIECDLMCLCLAPDMPLIRGVDATEIVMAWTIYFA